jgi:hypothetical protein
LEHGPRSDKKIKNSEQFLKCLQKAQREHGGKRLGWHRDGNQPVAGPHPDPDTSYETLHGSWDVNLQETRNTNRTEKLTTAEPTL